MRKIAQLEVITGPMFAGKSEELIRRIRRAQIGGRTVAVYKPSQDTRAQGVVTRNGRTMEAVSIDTPQDLVEHAKTSSADLVAIDEGQFFPPTLTDAVRALLAADIDVIVSALDLTNEERPWPSTAELLALATDVTKLTAVCVCGADATRTIMHAPSDKDELGIRIGDAETYAPRCMHCFHHGAPVTE